MKNSLICIKLGGSVITDKNTPYTARIGVIRQLAKSLKRINSSLIISHGSGSFGHTSAAKYAKKQGYTSKWGIAKVAQDAMEINAIVMKVLVDVGLPAVSFKPSSFLTSKNGKLQHAFIEPIEQALAQGLIPVVYGDVIWDVSWKSTIFSGEAVLNILSKYFQKKYKPRVIELCNVDGVLDLHGKVISKINKKSWKSVKKALGQASATDVTGGMKHKVEEAFMLAQSGVATNIINGTDPKVLLDAINNKHVGTIISI